MRCLVTGATGFVGAYVVRQLVSEGETTAILLRPQSDPWRIRDLLPAVTQITGDANRPESAAAAISAFAPEAVAHLAWAGISQADRNAPAQVYDNLNGSLALLKIAQEAACRIWVGLGSQAEYGPVAHIIDEETPARPNTLYGVSKLCTGLLSRSLCHAYGMRFAWLRLFSAYGPMDNPQWLLPSVIQCLLRGERPALTEGRQLWDFVYVEDVAKAICSTLRAPHAAGIFNLGSGEAHPLRSVIERIRDLIAPALPLGFGEVAYRPDQIMHLQASIAQLERATGWTPHVGLEEGLRRTVAWYLAHAD